jgi:tetratricopeptide (TPR) repeat protein
MVLILALPMLQQGEPGGGETTTAPPPGAAGAPGATGPGGGAPPDLSTMTPASAALRLFNRVMTASEAGNNAEAQQFLPMAIQAHEMARPLNLDQLYHLARLHQVGGDHQSALTVAREALGQSPNDLLGLMVGAESARALGDSAAAREYAARFLEVFDAERPKAVDHGTQLDDFRATARSITGG